MIAVIQAHKERKRIEWRYKNHKQGEPFEWTPTPYEAAFNFSDFDYRVKPEPPKPREFVVGWCPRHGASLKAWHTSTAPEKVCQDCVTILVREVLDAPSVPSA